MATRETRRDRGRRLGERLKVESLVTLRSSRIVAGISQRVMARLLGSTQSEYWRFENGKVACDVIRLAEAAAILGLDLAITFHPAGEPIRDKGHQALLRRFRPLLSAAWRVTAEMPLPMPGDPRVWDLLLGLGAQVIGVEAETRVRDVQALVRRIRARERDGGTDEVLLILSDSAANRRLVPELREALGDRFATPAGQLLAALRNGRPLPGSGVILAWAPCPPAADHRARC